MTIAQKLKTLLEEKNITASSLEKKAGVKVSSVQNIIYGRSKNPGIDTIKAIATALGCTLYDLLEDESSASSFSFNKKSISNGVDLDEKWNLHLYIQSLQSIESIINRKGIALSAKETFSFANEIYDYSRISNKKAVDLDFTRWLLEKHIEK